MLNVISFLKYVCHFRYSVVKNVYELWSLTGQWTTSASSKQLRFLYHEKCVPCRDCMLNLTCNLYSKICDIFSELFFSSRLLKMAATVMTVEFGTIHHYTIILVWRKTLKLLLCSSLDRNNNNRTYVNLMTDSLVYRQPTRFAIFTNSKHSGHQFIRNVIYFF